MRTSHLTIRKRVLEEKSKITDEEFFTSKEYCAYLTDLTEASTKKYGRPLKVIVYADPNDPTVAYIDPRGIFINVCNHITWSMPSRYLRSLSIEGLNAHENGHDLFTDNRIARACSIRDVVDLLSIQVIRDTGTQLHCRCPFCADRKAHLNVKLDKNVFRCNRCGEGGGVLHLYAAATNISMAAAMRSCAAFFSPERTSEEESLMTRPEIRGL